jgi:hypothetical protein
MSKSIHTHYVYTHSRTCAHTHTHTHTPINTCTHTCVCIQTPLIQTLAHTLTALARAELGVDFTKSNLNLFLGFGNIGRVPANPLTSLGTRTLAANPPDTTLIDRTVTGFAPFVGEMVHRIATGRYHTIVQTYLQSREPPLRLWAFGSNLDGQLGTPHRVGVDGPNAVPLLIPTTGEFDPRAVVSIYAGGSHTAVLDSSMRVWMFGSNSFGQIGTRPAGEPNWRPNRLTGVTVTSAFATYMSLGSDHTLIRVGGRVWAFGSNQLGQVALADGSTFSRTPVEMVVPGKQWATMCAGRAHSVLLSTDGELYTVGHSR